MVVRTPFAAQVRAACVDLLTEFAADVQMKLQVYRARPASVNPPTAFVDRLSDELTYTGPTSRQRASTADVVVLFGRFDSGDSVDQRDAFVDAFLDWVTDDVHAAGANTTIGLTSIDDEPTYVPDWVSPELQRTYYGVRLTLEGFAGD